jgi:hypothetical protein
VQISGTVVDGKTQMPIRAPRVVIKREEDGAEVASVPTGEQGRFAYTDDLNKNLGQPLVLCVDHIGYRSYESKHRADRDLVGIRVELTQQEGVATQPPRMSPLEGKRPIQRVLIIALVVGLVITLVLQSVLYYGLTHNEPEGLFSVDHLIPLSGLTLAVTSGLAMALVAVGLTHRKNL